MIALPAGKIDTAIPSLGIAASAYARGENLTICMVLSLVLNLMLIVKVRIRGFQTAQGA